MASWFLVAMLPLTTVGVLIVVHRTLRRERRLRLALTHARTGLRREREREDVLRVDVEHLKALLVNQPEGIVVVDGFGRVVELNAAAEALTGWSYAEASFQPAAKVLEFVNCRDTCGTVGARDTRVEPARTAADILDAVVRRGESFEAVGDVLLVSRYGARRVVAVSVSSLQGVWSPSCVGVEVQPSRRSRRPICGAVISLRDLCRCELHASRKRLIERFGMIQKMARASEALLPNTGQRGKRDCGDELASRAPRPPRRRVFRPQDLLFDVAHSLPRMLSPSALVVVKPSNGTAVVRADYARLHTVLLRLALAARPGGRWCGGTITLRARAVAPELEVAALVIGEPRSGPTISIDVQDSLYQHSREALLRSFEPLHASSRREIDRAFELLKVVDSIQEEGGRLAIRSSLSRGSTLSVLLPVSPD